MPDTIHGQSLEYNFTIIFKIRLYVCCGVLVLARPGFFFSPPQYCTHSPNVYYSSYIIRGVQSGANCIRYVIDMYGGNDKSIS